MKLIGGLMIFIGCTAIGLRLSSRLSARQKALIALMEAMLQMKSSVCGLGMPLAAAFQELSRQSGFILWANVFGTCGRLMSLEFLDGGQAWRRALHENRDELPFGTGDLNHLESLGELFGKSDREGQAAVFAMVGEKLSVMEKQAREVHETTGKLYRNLGALGGAAMVLLLI